MRLLHISWDTYVDTHKHNYRQNDTQNIGKETHTQWHIHCKFIRKFINIYNIKVFSLFISSNFAIS